METFNKQGFSAVSFWALRYGITDNTRKYPKKF